MRPRRRRSARCGIPFVFVTGYTRHPLLERHAGRLVVLKPYDRAEIASAIGAAFNEAVNPIGLGFSARAEQIRRPIVASLGGGSALACDRAGASPTPNERIDDLPGKARRASHPAGLFVSSTYRSPRKLSTATTMTTRPTI
jgi:hypothetical protein